MHGQRSRKPYPERLKVSQSHVECVPDDTARVPNYFIVLYQSLGMSVADELAQAFQCVFVYVLDEHVLGLMDVRESIGGQRHHFMNMLNLIEPFPVQDIAFLGFELSNPECHGLAAKPLFHLDEADVIFGGAGEVHISHGHSLPSLGNAKPTCSIQGDFLELVPNAVHAVDHLLGGLRNFFAGKTRPLWVLWVLVALLSSVNVTFKFVFTNRT